MKKTRFLVLALAVAIMLVGAGYAYWADSVNFEASITTGNLDFTFAGNSETFAITPVCALGNPIATGTIDYTETEGDDTLDNAAITVENLFPGATGKAVITLYNNSSIPTKLNDIMPKNIDLGDLNADEVTVSLKIYSNSISGELLVDIDDIIQAPEDEAANLPSLWPVNQWARTNFAPYENLVFVFDITMLNTGVGQGGVGSENAHCSFNFNPTFTQCNATEVPVDAE